jgi:DNA-binding MarR family transcriptional regulator
MDSVEDFVTEMQILYPRIYMACHVDHVRARSSASRISARDSAILAHLSLKQFQSPGALAKHLEVSASTLSEALHNLVSLGLVSVSTHPDDDRRAEFRLTENGRGAMKDASVLDSDRVAALFERLSKEDRRRAIEGLRILADAALR